MRRNWQPINLCNFAADFAIFQPNLHLTAHSYLSAAGRLHMLANVVWVKEESCQDLRKLLHPSELMVKINCGLDYCGLALLCCTQGGFELFITSVGVAVARRPILGLPGLI